VSGDAAAVKDLILSIISRSSARPQDSNVPDGFNMLAEGIVDSLGFVELMAELETRLGVDIDLGDLDPDHLGSIGPLSRYIAEKAARRPDGGLRDV
jgi:acyl carrier protein